MKIVVLVTYMIFLAVFSVQNTKAQDVNSDVEKLFVQKFPDPVPAPKPKFLFVPNKKIIKYNPLSLTFGGLMFVYQKIISPQLGSDCPYELSCSNYSKAVISRYGIIKGVALTSYRLMRCNRIAAIDIHPLNVNEKKKVIDKPEDYKLK